MEGVLDQKRSEEKEEVLVVEDQEEEEEVVLPGFRFHPTDEELVGFYLRRKVEKKPLSIEIIKQVDIYKYDPWHLPKVSTVGEKEWYFFCLRGRKYRNSIRPNRVTGSGFWKATGIDRPIYSAADSGDCIGLKKSLVYYRGSAGKGTKTDWMMHEFRLPSNNPANNENVSPSIQEAEIWTICRIFRRNITFKKYQSSKQTPADSNSNASSFESDTREYKCHGASYMQQNLVANYLEERNYLYGSGQWNPIAQPSLPGLLHQNMANPNTGEFFHNNGNWDELGRVMEFSLDPTLVHDCRSYS